MTTINDAAVEAPFAVGQIVHTVKGAQFWGEVASVYDLGLPRFDGEPAGWRCDVRATAPGFAGSIHVYPATQLAPGPYAASPHMVPAETVGADVALRGDDALVAWLWDEISRLMKQAKHHADGGKPLAVHYRLQRADDMFQVICALKDKRIPHVGALPSGQPDNYPPTPELALYRDAEYTVSLLAAPPDIAHDETVEAKVEQIAVKEAVALSLDCIPPVQIENLHYFKNDAPAPFDAPAIKAMARELLAYRNICRSPLYTLEALRSSVEAARREGIEAFEAWLRTHHAEVGVTPALREAYGVYRAMLAATGRTG